MQKTIKKSIAWILIFLLFFSAFGMTIDNSVAYAETGIETAAEENYITDISFTTAKFDVEKFTPSETEYTAILTNTIGNGASMNLVFDETSDPSKLFLNVGLLQMENHILNWLDSLVMFLLRILIKITK